MTTPEKNRGDLNPLQPEELEDYRELRSLLSPRVSLELLDDFAKWLFTLSGVVAALGAGFGGRTDLSSGGEHLFRIAVLFVAISLILAAFARLPLPTKASRYDRFALQRRLTFVLWVRFVLLAFAALLFAVGLALAGWAQVS